MFAAVVVVYVAFVAFAIAVPEPTGPLFHWYAGVPPFVGVAVNVMLVPGQIAPVGDTAIDTDGVTFGLTVIVITFDVAVPGATTQGELLVMIT